MTHEIPAFEIIFRRINKPSVICRYRTFYKKVDVSSNADVDIIEQTKKSRSELFCNDLKAA